MLLWFNAHAPCQEIAALAAKSVCTARYAMRTHHRTQSNSNVKSLAKAVAAIKKLSE